MYFKRLLTATAAAALVSALFVLPVSAHGHHRQTTVSTDCPVCTVEGCTEKGRHTHDGHDYCGYDHADGYCDGTCAAVSVNTASHCRKSRRHCHR